jgi:phosphate acetyltransferase
VLTQALLAVVVNRADHSNTMTRWFTGQLDSNLVVAAIPEDAFLVAPTVKSIMAAISGTLLRGEEDLLDREALGVMVAAMSIDNVVARLREGFVVLVPGDRTDAILGVLMAHQNDNFPSLAALVLYGGFELSEPVQQLIAGLRSEHPDYFDCV